MSRPPIFIEVNNGRVSAADAYAAEQLSTLPNGRYNMRVSKVTRAGREEREGIRGLWWAGCQLMAENSDNAALDTSRKVHEAVLMGLGFVRPKFRVDGSFVMVPVSTSEVEMEDDEAIILQEKARAYAIQRWGYDPWLAWTEQQTAQNGGHR